MATENIDVVVREDGSRNVQRNLENIGASASKAESAVDLLRKTLGMLGIALGVNQLKQYADTYTDLKQKVELATQSQSQAKVVMDQLYQISRDSRQSWEGVTSVYTGVSRAARDLGASQQDVLKFTDVFSKSLTISGTSAENARGAMMQLSMAMAQGGLTSRTFMTIMRSAPSLLQIVANNIKGTGGSIENLRQMMINGTVSGRDLFEAVLRGSDDVNKQFKKTFPTLSQAIGDLSDAMMKWFGESATGSGIIAGLVAALDFLSSHIDALIKVVLIASATFIAFKAALALQTLMEGVGVFGALTASVRAFTAALMANPLVAIVTAIVAVVSALVLFRDQIKLGIDDTTTLGDLMRAVWESITAGVSAAIKAFQEFKNWISAVFNSNTFVAFKAALSAALDAPEFQVFKQKAVDAINEVSTTMSKTIPGFDAVKKSVMSIGDEFSFTFYGIGVTVAKVLDLIINMHVAQVKNMVTIWGGLGPAVQDLMTQMLNVLLGKISAFVNTAGQLLNTITTAVGMKPIATNIDFKLDNASAGAAKKLGEQLNKNITQAMQGKTVENWFKGVTARAQQIGAERIKAAEGAGGLGDKEKGTVDPKAAAEAAKLSQELDKLLGSIMKVYAAQMRLDQAQKTLDDSEKAGLITHEYNVAVMEQLKKQMEDQLDPIGALNRKWQEEADDLKLTNDERQISTQLRAIEKQMLQTGIILTAQEIEQFKQRLQLLQDMNKESAAREKIDQAINGPMKDFRNEMTALMQMVGKGVTPNQALGYLANTYSEMFSGTSGALEGIRQKYEQTFQKIAIMRSADLGNQQQYDMMTLIQSQKMQQELQKAAVDLAQAKLNLNMGTWADEALVAFSKVTDGFVSMQSSLTNAWGDFFKSFTDGFADSIGRAIVYSESLGDALRDVARQALSQLISALVKMAIQWALTAAIGNTISASSSASSVIQAEATGKLIASAYAPAAVMASLATMGENAIAAISGMGLAMAAGVALSQMQFKQGGYTGNMGVDEVAGVVHGQEFVVNAQATKANRPLLEAMNNGADFANGNAAKAGGVGGSPVNVNIQNYGTSKQFEVQQLSESDIRVIARDEATQTMNRDGDKMVATHLASASSKTSRALGAYTTTQRNFK